MKEPQPFKWRHFDAEMILLCVRWDLRVDWAEKRFRQLDFSDQARDLAVDLLANMQRISLSCSRACARQKCSSANSPASKSGLTISPSLSRQHFRKHSLGAH